MRKILVVDTDSRFLLRFTGMLKLYFNDLAVEGVSDRSEIPECIRANQENLVLVSFSFPHEHEACVGLLSRVRELSPSSLCIVLSERCIAEMWRIVTYIKGGAYDVIEKRDYRKIRVSVANALRDLDARDTAAEQYHGESAGFLNPDRTFDESVRLYRGFFNAMAVGAVVIDAGFRITDINLAACRVLGVDRHAALSQTLDSLRLPALRTHIENYIAGIEDRHPHRDPCAVVTFGGDAEKTLRISVQQIHDECQNAPSRFIVFTEPVASEIRYHQLLDSVPVGIIMLVGDIVTFCNELAASLLGYESSAILLGKTIDRVVANDEEVKRILLMVASSSGLPKKKPEQARVRNKDGIVVDIEMQASRIFSENENSRLLVLRDVSDRAAEDRGRRANEEQLKALCQSAPISMLVVDKDFHVRDIGSLMGGGSGDASDALATPCESAMIRCAVVSGDAPAHSSKRQCQRCNLRSAIVGTVHTGLEVHNREVSIPRVVDAKLTVSTFLLHATRIQQNGEFLCIVILNDISEMTKAKDELTKAVSALKIAQERNKRHSRWITALYSISRAIARSKDALSMVSVALDSLEDQFHFKCACVAFPEKDGKGYAVQGISHRGADINTRLGVVPGARFDAERVPEFFSTSEPGKVESFSVFDESAADAACWHDLKTRMLQEGLIFFVKVPFAMEQGTSGLLILEYDETIKLTRDAKFFLADLADVIGLTLSNFRLFTELEDSYRKLEQAIKNLEMQRRMEAVGQIASGIAHDINNTLVPIKLYLDSLIEREDGISEKGKRYLALIKKSADDIESVTARLRSFYKKADFAELGPVSLSSVFPDIYDMTRPRWKDSANKKGIDIRFVMELDDDLPPVSANASELREALINMVFNAVDAMPTGGTITLAAKRENGRVCVTLADTGIGMSSETLERCMEPFFTTKGPSGTGLGLAAVYGSVQRFGGELLIQSELGSGTTIRMMLPVYAKQGRWRKAKDETAAKNARILLVDDDPRVIEVVKEMLLLDGHGIDAFPSASKALNAYDRAAIKKPDLVITDLGMPEMDGNTFARELKERIPDVPILLMTGWGKLLGKDERSRYIDKIISKPIDLETMRDSIGELLMHAKAIGRTTKAQSSRRASLR